MRWVDNNICLTIIFSTIFFGERTYVGAFKNEIQSNDQEKSESDNFTENWIDTI